jgi:hypothetical protein
MRAAKLVMVAGILVATAAFIPEPGALHCMLEYMGFGGPTHHSHVRVAGPARNGHGLGVPAQLQSHVGKSIG